ncbi:MAG: MarR family transcriptional regulator [Deltaproteobacteria bacterium]|nr:MarR family transcriptional regulator [Deltaproteobacteria bacterium]
MTPHSEHSTRLVKDIRQAFHLLKALGDTLHQDLGISSAMRGVMESLAETPATVSQLARARPVSRQHIQRLVDALLEKRLLRLVPNPAHKTSPLVALTPQGVRTFQAMNQKEAQWLGRLFHGIPPGRIQAAAGVLGELQTRLAEILSEFPSPQAEE